MFFICGKSDDADDTVHEGNSDHESYDPVRQSFYNLSCHKMLLFLVYGKL